MTKDQRNALVAAINRHPVYHVEGQDLSTERGVVANAISILNRIADDNDKFRRTVGALNRANAFRNGD